MSALSIQAILAWASVSFAFGSAYLWFKSTTARVNAAEFQAAALASGKKQFDLGFAMTAEDGSDVLQTLKLQSLLNRRAAAATGLATLLQAISYALS